MAGLPQKNYSGFVQDLVSQWAAQIGFQPTLQQGDSFLALMQSVAAQLVFLQALAQIVNALARVSTCGMVNGVQVTPSSDVDSFFAQFNFPRLPAVQAAGPVTMTKLTPAVSPVNVAPGAIVQTVGAAIQYAVIADPTQSAWDPSLGVYVLPTGQTSIEVSAQALLAGADYNVTAGQLSQLGSSIPGIDVVSNPAAISDGRNAESDDAYRARFVNYINSLSKATQGAIASAIEGVQQGIEYNLVENVNVAGDAQPGQFVAAIDNGTGAPPDSLILSVAAAVEAVRGFCIMPNVIAVQVEAVTITITIRVAAGFTQGTVNANVQNAVSAGVNATAIGGTEKDNNLEPFLFVSDVEGFAAGVAGVVSVQPGTLINGENADLPVSSFQGTRMAAAAVTVGNY